MKLLRFATVALLMSATVGIVFLRSDVDDVPEGVPLELLPHRLDDRQAVDIPIDQETLDVLGKGKFLNRLYTTPQTRGEDPVPPVSLFIGYFPTQRTGQAIHSPQNCLPGAGWTFSSEGRALIGGPDGRKYEVGDYIITNGSERQEVLYWYRAHGRSVASDLKAKLYMLSDAIRYNRTDGALIRVITPVQPGEQTDAARSRAVRFASEVATMLPAYIPD